MMRIAIGSDHGGFHLKENLKKFLQNQGFGTDDFGTDSEKPADYPDTGFKLAEAVRKRKGGKGILACKSGIGMAICANKVRGIRAALCDTRREAELSRRHNDANVIVLSANFLTAKKAQAIVKVWLKTRFDSGRHARRIQKVMRYEQKHWKGMV